MSLRLTLRAAFRLLSRSLLVAVRRRVEVIRRDTGLIPRPPFQAPLRLAAVGEAARSVVQSLALPEQALQTILFNLPEHIRDRECPHIVVTRIDDFARTVAAACAMGNSPALIITLGSNWALWRQLGHVPDGVTVLAIRSSGAAPFLTALINQIARNSSLKRAIKEAARESVRRRRGLLLIMDPATDHALQLDDAIEMWQIRHELLGQSAGASLEPSDRNLWELAKIPDPGNHQSYGQRLLDINVMRATYRSQVSRTLTTGTTLAVATPYLLAVHIGPRLRTSIIRGEGEADSHPRAKTDRSEVLDIVIQEKELKVSSRHTRQLTLAPDGPTPMIYFTLQTPAKTGMATLRLMVYRRNQMLQSYRVQAEITESEVRLGAADRGVTAELDFSFVSDLNPQVDPVLSTAVQPILTLSVNRDAGGTHAVFIKGAERAVGFSIPESGVSASLKRFRELLGQATYTDEFLPDGERKPRRWLREPGSDSRKFIRKLAHFGSDIYRAYLDNTAGSLRETLHAVRSTSDNVISIVRFDEHFAFPWVVCYDMHLPRMPTSEVCFGVSPKGGRCQHDHNSRAYCIRGFWGYRHQVQELLGGQHLEESVAQVSRNPGVGSLRFLADRQLQHGKKVASFLEGLEDSLEGKFNSSTDLLRTLWDETDRPAMLVFFGHLRCREADDEPYGPRIPLPEASPRDWLLSRDILEYLDQQAPWRKRNPIVVLLTCESAATTPETLTDFVIAFHRARAGAIIGTECLVLSDITSRFSEKLLRLVWEKQMPLGEAMTQVRRVLLEEGNPLVFAFSCIGRADLKVHRILSS